MTSSEESRRYGSQEPTKLVLPDGIVSTDGGIAQAFLEHGGAHLMPWQADRLSDWLARDFRGRWAAKSIGMGLSRQNGKTRIVTGRCDFGMAAYGEWIVYTAHLQKTATEAFDEMVAFFDNDEMKQYVRTIKTAIGREEIRLRDPNTGADLGRIKFLARTRNGGRGQHGDLLIFDEAQELTDDQQASFLPAISASRNPQVLYTGTPPDSETPGTVFRRIRDDALEGRSRTTAWCEWGIDSLNGADLDDRALWAMCNPSMGHLIMEDSIASEREQMAPDRFACERLGWWCAPRSGAEECPIDTDEWNGCMTDNPPDDGLLTYAVKFAPDGNTGTMAVCCVPDDGVPHVEVIATWPLSKGLGRFADWLMEREDKAAQIVIDGQSNAQALTDMLLQRDADPQGILRPSTREFIAACSLLQSAIHEKRITHSGQRELDLSATRSTKRKIGNDGGYGFRSTDEADAALVEACALAHWGALNTKRDPRRELIIL